MRVGPIYQRRAAPKTSKTASLNENRPAPELLRIEGGGSDPRVAGNAPTLDGLFRDWQENTNSIICDGSSGPRQQMDVRSCRDAGTTSREALVRSEGS